MYRLGNPYTLFIGALALFMFVLAAVTVRYRSRRVAIPLSVFVGGVGVWALGEALRLVAPTEFQILLWNKFAYFGIVWTVPSFFFLVMALTNRERWFRERYVAAIVGVSAVAYVVIAVNPLDLWRAGETITPGTAPPVLIEERGIAWVAWSAYAYVLIAAGLSVLVKDALWSNRSRLYRLRLGLVTLAILVPTVGNVLFTVFGVVRFDPAPFLFAVPAVAFAVAIYRYDLLDIEPIARDVVVSNVDSGVLVVDAGDRVVDANPRARSVLGLSSDAIPGIDLASVLSDYPEVFDRLRDTRDASETLSTEDEAGTGHFEVDVSPIEDDLGTYLGRVIVFTDVTERVRRERILEERTERLRRRNERLDELASIVSHDLRNPLDVTGRRVRRLRSEIDDLDLPEEEHSAIASELDGIERATGRASEITEELLTKSGSGDGTGIQETNDDDDPADGSGPVSLRTAATAAWDTVDTGDLELSILGSRSLPVDETDLRSLLENCFRNVVDHADGATKVTVGASSDGFYVADDGPGIPESDRDRVLERGYSMATDGSGLGLAIVEDVAEQYGWTVDVTESRSGGVRLDVTVGTE